MCGIAGIITKKSIPEPEVIKTMLKNLAHRGPDAEGVLIGIKVAFGHRRLSIIDLSDNANQPFEDYTKRFLIVFNGEIYNYQAIKSRIDYPWQSDSDTEVILAAYIKWGLKCLDYLNGMFAFAIYDNEKQELLIARDRLGVKPLYFYHSSEYFLFASEVRSLLSSGYIERKIDSESINGYLSGQAVKTPNSIVKDIHQLCPGEYAIYSLGNLKRNFYWSIISEKKSEINASIQSYKEVLNHTRYLLEEAVKSRMVADVNVGAFLSGGIDSSAIVAIMAKYSDRPVDTFSIIFDDKKYDERKYAQIIAQRNKTNHTELLLEPKELINNLDNYFMSMDSPTVDGMNTWMVSKLVSSTGIKVVLSGLGGDELFAGYPGFTRWKKISSYKSFFFNKIVRSGISKLSQFKKTRSLLKINDLFDGNSFDLNDFYSNNRAVFLESEINQLLVSSNSSNKRNSWVDLNNELINEYPVYSQYSIGELTRYTLDVLLKDTDQMSMKWALEVREPFFDYKLVEYVLTVLDKHKLSNKTPKVLLVEAMGDLLPKEIVNRPKMGFSFPWDSWIRNELREYCHNSLLALSKRDFFKPKNIMEFWNQYLQQDKRINWVQIWSLVVLENWLSRNELTL